MLQQVWTRRAVLVALMAVLGVAACGRKNNVRLPEDEEDDGDFL